MIQKFNEDCDSWHYKKYQLYVTKLRNIYNNVFFKNKLAENDKFASWDYESFWNYLDELSPRKRRYLSEKRKQRLLYYRIQNNSKHFARQQIL